MGTCAWCGWRPGAVMTEGPRGRRVPTCATCDTPVAPPKGHRKPVRDGRGRGPKSGYSPGYKQRLEHHLDRSPGVMTDPDGTPWG